MSRWFPWVVLVAAGCAGDDTGDGPTDAGPTDGPVDTDDTGTVDTDEPTDTDDPTLDECAGQVTSVTVEDTDAFLSKVLAVTTDGDTPVWAACSAGSDPDEVIVVESTELASSHELVIAGLFEDETWTCEVAATCPGAVAETATIETATLPGNLARGTASQNPGLTPSGEWTIFNTAGACLGGSQQYVQIVDLEGRVRWAHEVGAGYEVDIDAMWTGDRIHYGGGWGLFDEAEPHRGLVRQVDLAGNVLLELTQPRFGLGYNHHSEVQEDGSILSLTTHDDQLGTQSWQGVGIEQLDPTGQTLTWSWSSQELVDAGVIGAQVGSPWHNNSVTWLTDAHGDAVWVSLYIGQQVWRIDRDTGERTHVFGPEGDITFLDASGAPLDEELWTWAQHDPDYTEDGRILLYDNGVGRPGVGFGGDYSRVAEYQLDLDAKTATLLWDWTESPWYTPIIGDADYLDGDHVLVTKGVVDCLTFWIDQVSGLIEVDKASGEAVWRYDMDDDATAIFRSERYDGCEIFSNAAACPEVATRLDELRDLLAE